VILLELDRGKPTKAKITTVIAQVMKWKQLAEVLMKGEEAKIEQMENELKHLMAGLGADVKPTVNKKSSGYFMHYFVSCFSLYRTERLSRVTDQMLRSLTKGEDVADVVNLYTDRLNSERGDPLQLEEQHPTITFQHGEHADPGVEVESSLSPNILARSLGFATNGLPLLFNAYRNDGGVTPWHDPAAFENLGRLQNDPAFSPIRLRSHQIAGTHAVFRRLFSNEPKRDTLGMLIADDVGLGKTLQCMTILACLTELVGRQKARRSHLPPLIGMSFILLFYFYLVSKHRHNS